MLIQNSVQASAKTVSVFLQKPDNIETLINEFSVTEQPQTCLRIRDDGCGMTPAQMVETLSTFGPNPSRLLTGSEQIFNHAEHGVGLKIALLRLGRSSLIISRNNQEISIGLVSHDFIRDAQSGMFVAPMVSYELCDSDSFRPLTSNSDRVFELILRYCKPVFTSQTAVMRYVLNHLTKSGTDIFILNHSAAQQELYTTESDICLTREFLQRKFLPESGFETSLFQSVCMMYIQHPGDFTL